MNSADKGNIEDYAIKFVVNGEVYDATSYLKDHPGGADSILIMANEDASEDFTAIHSSDAWAKLAEVRQGHNFECAISRSFSFT